MEFKSPIKTPPQRVYPSRYSQTETLAMVHTCGETYSNKIAYLPSRRVKGVNLATLSRQVCCSAIPEGFLTNSLPRGTRSQGESLGPTGLRPWACRATIYNFSGNRP